MRSRHPAGQRSGKRRTTLTLPEASLSEAEQIARKRNVNLSTVVAEALSEGLRRHAATQRSGQILRAYAQAFAGFSEPERLILDGIILGSGRT